MVGLRPVAFAVDGSERRNEKYRNEKERGESVRRETDDSARPPPCELYGDGILPQENEPRPHDADGATEDVQDGGNVLPVGDPRRKKRPERPLNATSTKAPARRVKALTTSTAE
jgi:hypothetical protein